MDAVTFPQESVISFVEQHVIPTRLIVGENPLEETLVIKWTPALLMLDHTGAEHHRTVGFLHADDLKCSILTGAAILAFNSDNNEKTISLLESLIAQFPGNVFAPQAVFYLGVSRYRSSGDPAPLKAAYEQLHKEYPNHLWTRRAYPYRLL